MKKTTIASGFLTVGLLGGGVLWGVQNDKIQAEVPGLNARLTMEEAKSIAEKETKSVVESIELEQNITGPVYEVDTQDYDVEIDGNSGDMVRKDRVDADDFDDSNENVTVTQEEAVAAAQKQVQGTVKGVELDDGHYEIDIRDGKKETDIYVNGSTGEVHVDETDLDD